MRVISIRFFSHEPKDIGYLSNMNFYPKLDPKSCHSICWMPDVTNQFTRSQKLNLRDGFMLRKKFRSNDTKLFLSISQGTEDVRMFRNGKKTRLRSPESQVEQASKATLRTDVSSSPTWWSFSWSSAKINFSEKSPGETSTISSSSSMPTFSQSWKETFDWDWKAEWLRFLSTLQTAPRFQRTTIQKDFSALVKFSSSVTIVVKFVGPSWSLYRQG